MVFERTRLGKFLRASRMAAKLSQAKVSKELGYSSPQFISNWERGISSPPLKALPKIAQLYRISPEELVNVIIDETKDVLWREMDGQVESSTNL